MSAVDVHHFLPLDRGESLRRLELGLRQLRQGGRLKKRQKKQKNTCALGSERVRNTTGEVKEHRRIKLSTEEEHSQAAE